MFQLREYQQKAVDAGVEFMSKPTKSNWAVLVLPTGSWKSLVIANIAMNLEGKTIVLQPSKEILEQNYSKLKSYSVDDVSMYSASVWEKLISKITLCTIWSVINKTELFDDFDHIIIDECHLVNHEWWQYKDFIEKIWVKVLWLTATPYRLKQYMTGPMIKFITRNRNGIFQEVIHVTQIDEIESEWFLAKMNYYEVDAIKEDELYLNSTGVDYTDASVKNHLKKINMNTKVVEIVNRLVKAGRKHILLFTRFTWDAEEIVKNVWCTASIITGEMWKKERERILSQFKSWEIQVVANVWVLTTGFDFPELDCVVIARPTRSLWLYYQIVGRGMRPHKDKSECRVVDMAQAVKRFGHVSDLKVINTNGKWQRVVRSRGRDLTNVFTFKKF
jgi:DNA repair protein RadD